jgi:outer membrane protein assembly factor BamB
MAACASAVSKDGVVYVVGAQGGGGGGEAVAIKAGGKDDISKNILWRVSTGSYVTSPVIVGDNLYCVSDQGIAWCINRKDGKSVYKERLGSGAGSGSGGRGGFPGGRGGGSMFYASLIAADGKLFAVSRTKGTFVLAAEPKYEVLASNNLDDESPFNASPAIADGQLYLRSDKFLYCIGKK